jgi:hypothetical protein
MSSRTLAAILAPLALLLVVAGCSAGPAASGAPSSSAAPSAAPSAAASVAPSAAASLPATTRTDWGTIWDALPPTFPAFPGAQATETGTGPATAVLQLPERPDAAADWWKDALEAAGYRLEGVNGPMEDGSIVIDATGDGGCRVQASIAPMGDVTIATLLVASECPFR